MNDNPLPYKIITFIYGMIILIAGYISNYTITSPIMVGGGMLFAVGGILLFPYLYYIIINKEPKQRRCKQ